MVASTGIEPVLSALRGRRVNQLHHDATGGQDWPGLLKYINGDARREIAGYSTGSLSIARPHQIASSSLRILYAELFYFFVVILPVENVPLLAALLNDPPLRGDLLLGRCVDAHLFH